MSVLNCLNQEKIWNEFLKSKENSNNLPTKVIQEYKEYMNIENKIVDDIYEFSILRKVFIGKIGI